MFCSSRYETKWLEVMRRMPWPHYFRYSLTRWATARCLDPNLASVFPPLILHSHGSSVSRYVSAYCLSNSNCHEFLCILRGKKWASLVAQTVNNPPVMREIWVRFLGWEDPLEEGMATHSSILAWRIPMDRGA